jgi:hypothetical protein
MSYNYLRPIEKTLYLRAVQIVLKMSNSLQKP